MSHYSIRASGYNKLAHVTGSAHKKSKTIGTEYHGSCLLLRQLGQVWG